jgi:uridine phosphorylase
MPYPNFGGKHGGASLVEPEQYLEYLKAQGRYPSTPPPEGVLLCFQRRLMAHIEESHTLEPSDGFLENMRYLVETDRRVAVMGDFGVGAPTTAVLLDELIAFGVRRFVSVGTAGALQVDLAIGDIVVCDRAIRDEGTSHHYVAPAKYSYPGDALTDRLAAALAAKGRPFRRGTSWTIDAIYRETVAEARHYQEEGVATVEMEAAALFAVAQHRGVEIATAFAISDSLAELRWRAAFDSAATARGLEAIKEAAIAALLG